MAPSGESNGTTIDDAAINTHELRAALRQCKKTRSSGDDRLTYELLKEVPKKSHGTILKFFNNIWQRGQLPPDWKKAIVVSVLKPNKSAFEAGSYRPIALTSVLCKLMERLIANRLRWWMEDNNLYSKFQSGFRRRRSCQDHIMRLADEVHKATNNKQFTLSVMIDLEQAFDLVWHQGLLYNTKQLGLAATCSSSSRTS